MKYTNQTLTKNNQKGVYAPLFDCLSSQENNRTLLALEQLKESIMNEVELILNTRPAAKNWDHNDDFWPLKSSLPQYFGLRDFTFHQASNELGLRKIAQEISIVIERYEPRLKKVKVKLTFSTHKKLTVIAEIAGDIQFGSVTERASFPIQIKHLFYQKSS